MLFLYPKSSSGSIYWVCLLLFVWSNSCFGLSSHSTKHNRVTQGRYKEKTSRRQLCQTLVQTCGLVLATWAVTTPCQASNLPESTGANTSGVGTVQALLPIVELRSSLANLQSTIAKLDGPILQMNGYIPKDEVEFKRLFDAYSDPVSYKQKFLDQNAFLVYYTKGFDGPGRANIEAEINERQTQQFGLRNEAWIAWENFLAELKFIRDDDNDCSAYLSSTLRAVDSYLALVPPDDLNAAKSKLGVSW